MLDLLINWLMNLAIPLNLMLNKTELFDRSILTLIEVNINKVVGCSSLEPILPKSKLLSPKFWLSPKIFKILSKSQKHQNCQSLEI